MTSWRHIATSNLDMGYIGYGLLPDDHFVLGTYDRESISPVPQQQVPILERQLPVVDIQPPVDDHQLPVDDNQPASRKPLKRKGRMPHSDHAVALLANWYEANRSYPFAKRETVVELAKQTQLTESQVRYWLANRRKKFGECRKRKERKNGQHSP